MSEQRVLEELIYDKEEVANEAKKIAKEAILRQQRAGRDNFDDDKYYESAITTVKNNNRWKLTVIVNVAKYPKWYHRAVCCCEPGHGGMDYYYVRGFSNARPYFIKISSHAIKRLKERWLERIANEKVEYSGGEFAPLVIQRGEVITWMKVSDVRLLALALHTDDSHVLTTMFCTSHGFYLGYETEQGNYEFRTYLGWERNLKKKGEDVAQYICHESYLMLNARLMGRTDKDILDMYGFTLDRDNYPFSLLP